MTAEETLAGHLICPGSPTQGALREEQASWTAPWIREHQKDGSLSARMTGLCGTREELLFLLAKTCSTPIDPKVSGHSLLLPLNQTRRPDLPVPSWDVVLCTSSLSAPPAGGTEFRGGLDTTPS